MTPYLLHHLLERSAAASPEAIAVIDGTRCLSYADLDRRSSQLANLLIERGVRRGDRVALYLDKSFESVVGLYGVMKAGAAYVPLDPSAPVGRLAYIIEDCAVRAVVTGIEKADKWAAAVGGATQPPLLVVANGPAPADAPTAIVDVADVDRQPVEGPEVGTISLDLAYILYTSGSTGQPKGVMLSHRNALAFVEWAAATFQIGPGDRLSNHAPLHFDLSVFDLFVAALAGARVVLVPSKASLFPAELRGFIEEQGITVWYSVPTILTMLVTRGSLEIGHLPTLRVLLFAGEVFPTKYLRALMKLLPGVRFANLYGPTETNVCTWFEVPPLPDDQDEPIPIGRPIADVEAFAIQEDGTRAPIGTVGELFVRGATVMQGYWGDPERTASPRA